MKRVLIIDDDPTICRLLETILEDQYEVNYATSLEAASRLLIAERFDLIVADYFLGNQAYSTSNWPLGETCKNLAPNTPVVALTGLDPSLQDAIRSYGAKAIIPKPFDMDDLLSTIDQSVA